MVLMVDSNALDAMWQGWFNKVLCFRVWSYIKGMIWSLGLECGRVMQVPKSRCEHILNYIKGM